MADHRAVLEQVGRHDAVAPARRSAASGTVTTTDPRPSPTASAAIAAAAATLPPPSVAAGPAAADVGHTHPFEQPHLEAHRRFHLRRDLHHRVGGTGEVLELLRAAWAGVNMREGPHPVAPGQTPSASSASSSWYSVQRCSLMSSLIAHPLRVFDRGAQADERRPDSRLGRAERDAL